MSSFIKFNNEKIEAYIITEEKLELILYSKNINILVVNFTEKTVNKRICLSDVLTNKEETKISRIYNHDEIEALKAKFSLIFEKNLDDMVDAMKDERSTNV